MLAQFRGGTTAPPAASRKPETRSVAFFFIFFHNETQLHADGNLLAEQQYEAAGDVEVIALCRGGLEGCFVKYPS